MLSLLYKNIGLKIKKSIAISHIKVNSLRKKMTEVKELITKKTDICLISETKHDQSFPNQQFQIHGYTMFQRERDKYRRVKPFYLNEHIPSKALHLYFITGDNEVIYYWNFPLKFSNGFVLLSIKHHLKRTNTSLVTCKKLLVS